MSIKTYTRNRTYGDGVNAKTVRSEYLYLDSVSSPRIKGKLALRQNRFDLVKERLMYAFVNPGPTGAFYAPGTASEYGYFPPGWSWASLDSNCRSRLNGKLRKGSASLGVTMASWKQSRDMIISRSANIGHRLDATVRRLEKLPRNRRPYAESPADVVLETKFGWQPLFQDFQAALTTVCQDGVPDEWVTASATSGVVYSSTGGSFPTVRRSIDGQAKVRATARVVVSNPNLWLLNRMGLVNPGTVIWDLIPWSFVVNMFVNVNAMIESVTDEVGLTFSDISLTRSALLGHEIMKFQNGSNIGPSDSRSLVKWKNRTLDTLPQKSWQVKVPDLNWDLAVTAGALALQKFRKVNDLLRRF